MRIKSTTAFRIVSRHSRFVGRCGAVTVVICYHWAKRTGSNVQVRNVIVVTFGSLVTLDLRMRRHVSPNMCSPRTRFLWNVDGDRQPTAQQNP